MPQKRSRSKWYKLIALFDRDKREVLDVAGQRVSIEGWLPPRNECAVVLVPKGVSRAQGEALQALIEAQIKKPVLLLTNNVQFVKLRPLSSREAAALAGNASEDGTHGDSKKA